MEHIIIEFDDNKYLVPETVDELGLVRIIRKLKPVKGSSMTTRVDNEPREVSLRFANQTIKDVTSDFLLDRNGDIIPSEPEAKP